MTFLKSDQLATLQTRKDRRAGVSLIGLPRRNEVCKTKTSFVVTFFFHTSRVLGSRCAPPHMAPFGEGPSTHHCKGFGFSVVLMGGRGMGSKLTHYRAMYTRWRLLVRFSFPLLVFLTGFPSVGFVGFPFPFVDLPQARIKPRPVRL